MDPAGGVAGTFKRWMKVNGPWAARFCSGCHSNTHDRSSSPVHGSLLFAFRSYSTVFASSTLRLLRERRGLAGEWRHLEETREQQEKRLTPLEQSSVETLRCSSAEEVHASSAGNVANWPALAEAT